MVKGRTAIIDPSLQAYIKLRLFRLRILGPVCSKLFWTSLSPLHMR